MSELSFRVAKGVPVPKKSNGRRGSKYDKYFDQLTPGEGTMFKIPEEVFNTVHRAFVSYCKRKGTISVVATRKLEDGTRGIWYEMK